VAQAEPALSEVEGVCIQGSFIAFGWRRPSGLHSSLIKDGGFSPGGKVIQTVILPATAPLYTHISEVLSRPWFRALCLHDFGKVAWFRRTVDTHR